MNWMVLPHATGTHLQDDEIDWWMSNWSIRLIVCNLFNMALPWVIVNSGHGEADQIKVILLCIEKGRNNIESALLYFETT